MEVNAIGVAGIIVFYLVILFLGIWAGCKKSKHENGGEEVDQSKEVMLAGRGIGLFVGCFTMTGKFQLSVFYLFLFHLFLFYLFIMSLCFLNISLRDGTLKNYA